MTKFISVAFILAASMGVASAEEAFTQHPDGTWTRNPHGCGTPDVAINPGPLKPGLPAVGLRTVFLNKNGGTYTAGNNTSSATNVSTVINRTGTIPPIDAAFNWPVIAQCVKDHFQKFNVRVVETEPTSGTYIEAVVGGSGQELGFGGGGLFGIASADNFCGVTEDGIAFNFSKTHLQVPRRDEELCATIAHEVGHLIALEHEQLPQDIMSYVLIDQSNTKDFVNQNSGCGTAPNDPGQCSCGGSTTNSHQRLVSAIGLRDTEMVPPTVDISTPTNALQVPPTFDIIVNATDNMTMDSVLALIDNVEIGLDTEPEGTQYKITARGVAEGNHTLAVVGTDAAGNMTRKEIAIVVRLTPTGDTCTINEACSGGICAQGADGNFCSQQCDPAASTCPADFDCIGVGNQNICAPAEGGCCSASGDPRVTLLMMAGVAAVMFRRRRRR